VTRANALGITLVSRTRFHLSFNDAYGRDWDHDPGVLCARGDLNRARPTLVMPELASLSVK
jgi:hypothetical protein